MFIKPSKTIHSELQNANIVILTSEEEKLTNINIHNARASNLIPTHNY